MIMEKVKEDIDVEFDIGNMSIYTTHNAGFSGDADNFEKEIHELSLQNFRKVFGKLLEVRNTIDDTRDAKKLELQIHDFDKSEYHVVLPNGTTLFPRFMPMPSKKDLTKWEKFAKEKGIGRKKKTNMVFDEVTQTYVPRHGSKSLKNLNEKRDVVRVIKPGQDIMTDTFEEDRLEKKESQQKQKIKEIRNRLR